MLNTKGMRFPIDVILVCIRWYAAYTANGSILLPNDRSVFSSATLNQHYYALRGVADFALGCLPGIASDCAVCRCLLTVMTSYHSVAQ
jgi:hypothetical protein